MKKIMIAKGPSVPNLSIYPKFYTIAINLYTPKYIPIVIIYWLGPLYYLILAIESLFLNPDGLRKESADLCFEVEAHNGSQDIYT